MNGAALLIDCELHVEFTNERKEIPLQIGVFLF